MKTFLKRILCLLSGHDWTCHANEGIPPRKDQMTFEGFKEYAQMYCKRCGHYSELNERYK